MATAVLNSSMRDKTLLDALRVAEFLQDSVTAAAISRTLLLALVRAGKVKAAPAVPSEKEHARAAQITSPVPPRFWPSIVAAVEWRGGKQPFSATDSRVPSGKQLSRLVRLLPHTLHPAVSQACRSGSHLILPRLPRCANTCAMHRGTRTTQVGAPPQLRRGSSDAPDGPRLTTSRNTVSGMCGPECASVLFRLLAAAAPLAGGSSERAWDPAGPSPVNAGGGTVYSSECTHSTERPVAVVPVPEGRRTDHEPAAQRRCAQRPQHTHVPGAAAGASHAELAAPLSPRSPPTAVNAVTQLTLCLSWEEYWGRGSPGVPEPPRWCVALAQLRMLRELSVSAVEPMQLSPPQFGAALETLPALHALHIHCSRCNGGDWSEVRYVQFVLAGLVSRVAMLTQLSALSLIECFCLGEPDLTARVTELSRLTSLTSLALQPLVERSAAPEPFMRAVRALTGLRELRVGANMGARADSAVGAHLVVGLCAATELTALTSLSTPGLSGVGPTYMPMPMWRLHYRLARENGRLLSRLAALDLTGCYQSRGGKQPVSSMLQLLAATPVLRSLRLGQNWLRDAGLLQLAELPCVPSLTRLAIDCCDASHAGVCAVLQALVQASAAGGPGVQELDISGNSIEAPDAAALGAVLQQMTSLEALNVRHMFTEMAAVREVVGALEALPRLRRLRVFLNADQYMRRRRLCGAEAAVAPLLTGLGHVLVD